MLLNGFNALLVIIKLNNWSLVMERKLLSRSKIPYFLCRYKYYRILSNTDLDSIEKTLKNEFRYIHLVSILETYTNMDIHIISFSGYGYRIIWISIFIFHPYVKVSWALNVLKWHCIDEERWRKFYMSRDSFMGIKLFSTVWIRILSDIVEYGSEIG